MREEEGRCGAGGRRGEGRCKGCKPLPFWRACGRAREERDEADAKGGGLFSPLPCRRRAARGRGIADEADRRQGGAFLPSVPAEGGAFFLQSKKKRLVAKQKRSGAKPCFCRADGIRSYSLLGKKRDVRGGASARRRNTVCNRKKNAVVTPEQTDVKLFC